MNRKWIIVGSIVLASIGASYYYLISLPPPPTETVSRAEPAFVPPEKTETAVNDQKTHDNAVPEVLRELHDSLSSPTNLLVVQKHQVDRTLPLAEIYDDLVDKAMNGNSDAAIDLAGSLSECMSTPRTEEQLEGLVNYTTQTRMVEGFAFPVDDLDSAVSEIRDNFRFCNGVPKDQALDHIYYMKIAAENGNLEAKINMLSYGSMNIEDINSAYARAWSSEEEMKGDLARHLQDAIDKGSARALRKIRSYQGEDSLNLTPTQLSAYGVAYNKLRLERPNQSEEARSRYSSALQRELDGLSPYETEEVIKLANEVLSRDNCCFFVD